MPFSSNTPDILGIRVAKSAIRWCVGCTRRAGGEAYLRRRSRCGLATKRSWTGGLLERRGPRERAETRARVGTEAACYYKRLAALRELRMGKVWRGTNAPSWQADPFVAASM